MITGLTLLSDALSFSGLNSMMMENHLGQEDPVRPRLEGTLWTRRPPKGEREREKEQSSSQQALCLVFSDPVLRRRTYISKTIFYIRVQQQTIALFS